MTGWEIFDDGRQVRHQIHSAKPVTFAGEETHSLHAYAKPFLSPQIVSCDQSIHLFKPQNGAIRPDFKSANASASSALIR